MFDRTGLDIAQGNPLHSRISQNIQNPYFLFIDYLHSFASYDPKHKTSLETFKIYCYFSLAERKFENCEKVSPLLKICYWYHKIVWNLSQSLPKTLKLIPCNTPKDISLNFSVQNSIEIVNFTEPMMLGHPLHMLLW